MDRKWMSSNRCSREYIDGVKDFITFATEHTKDPGKILCPCLSCCFGKRISQLDLLDHLVCYGIDQTYIRWTRHGETNDAYSDRVHTTGGASDEFDQSMFDEDDGLEEMVNMVEGVLHNCPNEYEKLKGDAEKPLYVGSTKYTRLLAVLKLYNFKARYGLSDSGFTALLELLQDMLPEENVLPTKTYEAKRILCSTTGMGYEKIHACPNDCVLFRNQYATLEKCPKCNASRYRKKKGKSPLKVLWYFPIVPRFRRLYSNAEIAKQLTWHADERIKDTKLRHPADAPQWKKIDHEYPDFADEVRNLRLALSTDGINPHGVQSSTHSTWPVILMIYNLPPHLIMKRKFMMLSMLISGPRQPGNDIDVYLAPLIDDLKLLWDEGVSVYDGYMEESFTLKAMLFGTINDFPAYGNLSGYSVKGYGACPICEDDTHSMRLHHCKKNVYMGHRRFLPSQHRWRKWKKPFNGDAEEGSPPKMLTGSQVYSKVKDLDNNFGKPFAKQIETSGWKKKSIFFELPYWKSLYVRHFLDVMHIEKNICDSLIGTLLNIQGKSKDNVNSRLDLVNLGIREELAPIEQGSRTYLPPAAYTLSRKEKKLFCEFLQGIKVPEGYSSNIKNLVSVKELKLKNLKSHDCHVLMQNFLPVGIRSILPKKLRNTITKLCVFFKLICSKVVDSTRLQDLQRLIVCTLCELEMYFPPSFFDIMVHLTVHLVKETQLCGPVYLRWMYPNERFMKILKGYVKNRYRPEGCIAESYMVEEASDFCADFLSNVDPVGIPKSRHDGRRSGKGTTGSDVITISVTERDQAHLYVLHNTDEVEPYVEEHKDALRLVHGDRNENLLTTEHNKQFAGWLKNRINDEMERNPDSVSEKLKCLSKGPSLHVLSYNGYAINGYTFYTQDHDKQSTMQNSGVTLVADSWHRASAKDTHPIYASMSYFGVIERIWELDYSMFRVPVFKCQWVNNNSGLRIDDLGFVQVDLSKVWYEDDPFILAAQAEQAFYIPDPAKKNWSIVLPSNKNRQAEVDFESNEYLNINNDDPSFENLWSAEIDIDGDADEDEDGDGPLYVRHDHKEGTWVKRNTILNPTRILKNKILNQTRKRKR